MTNSEMIVEMMEMQKKLDAAIYESKNVKFSYSNCMLALMDEVGELTHELKPTWCWWKDNVGEVDRSKVLEELVDVFHFVLSIANFLELEAPTDEEIDKAPLLKDIIEDYEELTMTFVLLGLFFDKNSIGMLIMHFVNLAWTLEFTIREVYEEYKRKNQVNYDRLNSGY